MAIVQDHAPSADSDRTKWDNQEGRKKECKEDPVGLWHLCFGRIIPVRTVKKQLKAGILPPPKYTKTNCILCTRNKFSKRFDDTLKARTKVARLSVDTEGHVEANYTVGHRYVFAIVKDYSSYILSSLIKTKGEASDAVSHFIKWFKKKSSHVVIVVQVDKEGAFKRAKNFF